jgi:hypothetical protein
MEDTTVVTNLRLDKRQLTRIRSMAAELNMSVNSYIVHVLQLVSNQRELGVESIKRASNRDPIWDLPKLAQKARNPRGISEDDEVIYG